MTPASAGRKLRLSYCTTCRGRLADLQRTLPANLALLAEGEEIVVLDYNSQADGLRDWLLGGFGRELGAGRLRVFSERSAPRFIMSHAKNVAHLLAADAAPDVIINLDADNFLTPGYLVGLREWAEHTSESSAMLYPLRGSGGFKGRTAVRRVPFLALGGYDEEMDLGYGYEEIDLYKRLLSSGLRAAHIAIDPASAIPTPEALKAAGQKNPGSRPQDTSLAHRYMCEANLRAKRYIANADRTWGMASVYDHNDKHVQVGYHQPTVVLGLAHEPYARKNVHA